MSILRQQTPKDIGPGQTDGNLDSKHPGRTQDQGRLMMVTLKRLLASSHLQPWDVSSLCHQFPEHVPFCVGTDRSSVMGWMSAKLGSLRMSLVNNLFQGASESGLLLLLCGE